MSICFEKARELGQLILESEESKNLADAEAAFEADENAKNKFNDYKTMHQNLQMKISANELTQEEVNAESAKLAEAAAGVKLDPSVAGLIFAEDNYNNFVNQVMAILKATITGEAVNDCSGGCTSCPGCSPQ